jgi:hypothetical protein
VKVGLPYMLGQLTVVPYDDGTFKFGAGVARDGCAIWQDAGVVAAALLLIFAINFKSHQNELDKTWRSTTLRSVPRRLPGLGRI